MPPENPRKRAPKSSARPSRGETPPAAGDNEGANPPPETPTVDPQRRTADEQKLHAALSEMYTMLGVVVTGAAAARNDPDLLGVGVNMAGMNEGISDAWIDLARRNPAVKKALKSLTEVSALGVVVGLHLTMVSPFLAGRGIIPMQMAGGPGVEAAQVFTQTATAPPAQAA